MSCLKHYNCYNLKTFNLVKRIFYATDIHYRNICTIANERI